MKKFFLFFIFMAIFSTFFTACSDGTGKKVVYLSNPDVQLYEKGLDSVTISVKAIEVLKRDNLWDLSQKMSGDPYRWKEVFDLNYEFLKNRVTQKFIGGKNRTVVWIYPGEIIYVPANFDISKLHRLAVSVMNDGHSNMTYFPTKLKVKQLSEEMTAGAIPVFVNQVDENRLLNEESSSLNNNGEKLLYKNETASTVAMDNESSSFGWLWSVLKWIGAILGLLLVLFLSFYILGFIYREGRNLVNRMNENRRVNDPNNQDDNEDDDGVFYYDLEDLNGITQTLQETGGKLNLRDGNFSFDLEIPEQNNPKVAASNEKKRINK